MTSMRRAAVGGLALAVAAGLALTAPGTARAATPAGTHRAHGWHQISAAHLPRTHLADPRRVSNAADVSGNWSGYADAACSSCALRYVAAVFTIPSVNCAESQANANVSEWVGLDGWTDNTVEQTGIDAYCNGATAEYYGWVEMFPSAPLTYTGPMNVGDAIEANVYYNASTGQWQTSLTDVTNGNYLDSSQPCPAGSTCRNSSAEVITEAPASGGILPLADYGQMTYAAAQVTSRNGTRGDLASNGLWSADSVTMDNAAGQTSTPSAVEGGQAFLTTWRGAA